MRLYTFEEVPLWLQDNPGIRTGYRCYLSFEECVQSLFILSNELVNVWTHLLGFFVFIYCLLFKNEHVVFSNGGDWLDWLVITIYTVSAAFCMGSSATYHLFKCNSQTAFCHCMKLDHLGIAMALLCTYFPGLYFCLYCDRYLQVFCCTCTFLLAVAKLYCSVAVEGYSDDDWEPFRLRLFILIGGFGIFPSIYFIFSHGVFSHEVQYFLPGFLQPIYWFLQG